MRKNLTIGKQIGIGIALILTVFALVAAFAISGLKKSAGSFEEYRTFARESVLSGRVQANMLIASNAASDFLRTRNEESAETFEERFRVARDFAIQQQASMDDPRRNKMSEELVASLDLYDDKAHELFDLMRRRDAILQDQLNPQGVRMRESLEEIMVSANHDLDSEAAYLAGIALKRVLLGRVHLLRFLEDNKNEDVIRVRDQLGVGFETSYSEMAAAIENPERHDLLEDFSAAREIYLAGFEEMVTLIEDRNHLVDREMVPLDRSISDTAERIKLSLKETQDTLGPRVEADNGRTVNAVILGSILGAALAIFIAWTVIRGVTRPVDELVGTVKEVQQSGNLSQRLKVAGANEIATVASTLNGFLSSLQGKATIARDVADGKLETQVDLLSEHDTMGHSLQEMLETLKENEKESKQRDWARDGQEKIDDGLRGVVDREELVSVLIKLLCRHLEAQRGALFLSLEDPNVLDLAAEFAGDESRGATPSFKLGEGLVGQVAKDRKPLVIDQVPEGHMPIRSSFADSAPGSLALFPLVYEDRVLGVIELASIQKLSGHRIEFLESVHESLCVALLAAERQQKLSSALEEGKRINFLSDIALELSDCAYWHVDYSEPDHYFMSERAATMLGESIRTDGRYHLETEWFSRLLEANPETAAEAEKRYQRAVEGIHDHYDATYAYRRPKDGEIIWLRAAGNIVRGDDGKIRYMYGVYQDVTSRVHAEEDLKKARHAADAANRAKSDFLSSMSHELRTPLNGVLGYVQILQRDRTLGPSQKKSLDSINHCGEHLLSLINDVLDLSKIEAGKLEISLEPTDLSVLIDGVQDIVRPKAESRGLNFVVKASPEVPRGIVTDPMKLRQVLINLLGNSVKFTHEGTITLRVAEAIKGELRFDVEDTGMGIGPEKLGAIFEPFKQAEGGETEGGTGLGLAISRRIAEALGGSLTATSELGEGSCFSLTLPLEETDDLKADDFSAVAPDLDVHFRLPPGMTRSVLIADDRETNREILDHVLSDAGFETVLATDGDEALDELRKRDFDIVLCDVRMPRMNGIEVIKAIRADEKLKGAIVFAVTASVFPEFRQQALDAGFDDFLMKPLRVGELAKKMSKALDLEFVIEADDVAELESEERDPIELFQKLPAELIDELTAAAKVRNLTQLGEIARKLLENEQTSIAGHHLEGLIVAFDFAGLKTIVEGMAALKADS